MENFFDLIDLNKHKSTLPRDASRQVSSFLAKLEQTPRVHGLIILEYTSPEIASAQVIALLTSWI